MDKKTFNTVLASVMAGAMTLGVASFANKAADKTKKETTTTTKTTKATKEHKDSKAADKDTKAADHECGKDGTCSNKE